MTMDRLSGDPDDANTRYFYAVLRHQVGVRRFSTGEVKKLLAIVEKSDSEVAKLLRKRLKKLTGKTLDVTSERYKALISEVTALRKTLRSELYSELKGDLTDFGKQEAAFEKKIVDKSLYIELDTVAVTTAQLKGIVTTQPFTGGTNSARTLTQWFDSLSVSDQSKLTEAVQLGLLQGETTDQITRRVVGTRKASYADGILAINRRNAEAVVRTAINHVSNASRAVFWEDNEELFSYLVWVSVLDGRTSTICRARDGHIVIIGDAPVPVGRDLLIPQDARPPGHPNCRSVMAAVFSIDGVASIIGDRPYVTDVRTGRQRQIDFRAQAKANAGGSWSAMSVSQRNAAIKSLKQQWATENIGTIPAETTYGEWLAKQSVTFQDDVLGITKGKLFRTGKIEMDQFVDYSGKEYTLAELAATRPELFESAGVDLSQFNG